MQTTDLSNKEREAWRTAFDAMDRGWERCNRNWAILFFVSIVLMYASARFDRWREYHRGYNEAKEKYECQNPIRTP